MDGRPRTFAELVRIEDDDLDLARAALAVARTEFPGLEDAPYERRLDELAERVRKGVPPRAGPLARAEAMGRVLFEEEGLRGNLEEYYDPQNSYLNRVLDRRLGIPITLSLVAIEVGRRAGLPVVGVGLPGHFIVKVAWPHDEVLLDPFYRGAVVDRQECQRRLDAIYGGRVVLTEQFLRGVSKRDILARLLYNLKRIHGRANDTERGLRVLDMLLALQPHAFEDRRDRGMLRYKAGRYGEAIEDLRAYLRSLPGAPDKASVLRALQACERLRPTK